MWGLHWLAEDTGFGTWLGFLLEAALREAHPPPTPGTWSVNGSRTSMVQGGSPPGGWGRKSLCGGWVSGAGKKLKLIVGLHSTLC